MYIFLKLLVRTENKLKRKLNTCKQNKIKLLTAKRSTEQKIKRLIQLNALLIIDAIIIF